MAKVIVERPRFGSRLPTKGKGYERITARFCWEDQPKREAMKLRGRRMKSLNEHLAPLRRYLAGQVGRPWNKIFADVCRYLDRNSAVQDHVRDHLEDYVATCVMVRDGELCYGTGNGVGRPIYSLFYVCPRSGILKKNPNAGSRWEWRRPKPLIIHFLDNRSALVRKDGAWHVVTLAEMPLPIWNQALRVYVPTHHESYHDVHLHRGITREQAQHLYSRPVYAVSSRLASKSEVRPVVNSYPRTNVVR